MDDLRWSLVTVVLAVVGVALASGAGGMWFGLLGILAVNLGAFALARRRRSKRLAATADGEAPPGPGAWFDVLGAGWSAILVSMIVATGLQYLSHGALVEAWTWLLSTIPAAAGPLALGREGIARAAGGYRRLIGRTTDVEEGTLPDGDTDRLSSPVFPLVLLPLLLLPATTASAQQEAVERDLPCPEDVSTIDGIIAAYYEVISGPAGERADVARDRSLHHPDAWVAIASREPSGEPRVRVTTLDGYHGSNEARVEGFWEWETGREVRRSGAMAHVWSHYATARTEGGEPIATGVNSITLFWDGDRWWIMGWMFDAAAG